MRIVRFEHRGRRGFGIVSGDNVLPAGGSVSALSREGDPIALAAVRLLSPVRRQAKIIGVGRNYADHAAEDGADVPTAPLIFAKLPNSLVGPGDPIVVPQISDQVDYEAELGVVIGASARGVSAVNARDHVLGFTCVNDVSARDLQLGDQQWTRGKSLDTFCPVGPWIVTPDEIPDPHSLTIRCVVNGEMVQDASTGDMVFDVDSLISFISQGITLEPGDLIATGTPGGVGFLRRPPRYLTPGDVVRVEIDRIGHLENPAVGTPWTSGDGLDRGRAMNVRLPYGRGTLHVSLPEEAVVLTRAEQPALAEPESTIREALRNPRGAKRLRTLAKAGATVGISVCDVTRAFPAKLVLPVVLDEIEGARATLFVATGTHRVCTDAELESMFGESVLSRVTVVQHDATDRDRHASVGRIPGTDTDALIERRFLDQDVHVTLGFIEPHFFAGFSGGPKMVAPGLAGLDTVLELHSAERIGHPLATWGVLEGNPVHELIRWIAQQAGIDFSLDVTLDSQGRVTGVFAGALAESHSAGCEFARRVAMVAVEEPFDLVITTNGSYPLDQNLYQSVKGMSAAAQITKEGGAIIIATECSDGLPSHGRYGRLLEEAKDPGTFLKCLPAAAQHDQWQVQVQAMIQTHARVFVKANGLTPEQIKRAWLEPADDVGDLIHELRRQGRHRIAVLPEGPQTIPYVSS